MNKVLIMGYNEQTGTKYGGTWAEETIATQAMVWMVSTGQYGTSWETRLVDALLANSPNARSIYNTMRNNVQNFSTIPSFAGAGQWTAPSHELKYNMVNGRYELTLTDTNGVLSQFDFAANGISFTRNGNQLTISTTNVAENALVTAYKTLPPWGISDADKRKPGILDAPHMAKPYVHQRGGKPPANSRRAEAVHGENRPYQFGEEIRGR